MKKKIILGILPSDPYNDKEAFLDQMALNGFTLNTISSKIEDIAKYLLNAKDVSEITDKDIYALRKKGYSVNKLYWINLLLTSFSDEEDKILIYDLWQDDLYGGYVTPIVSDPILVPNLDFIKYPVDLSNSDAFRQWIKEIEEKTV